MVSMLCWKTKSILKLSFIYRIINLPGLTWRPYLAGYYGFNTNISFTFQAVKISLLIPHIYVYVRFVNVFGDFWVYLWINSFPQRISKIYLMLFKNQNLKLKIGRHTPNNCPPTWGVLSGQSTVWQCSKTIFFTFKPSLNFLKFHLDSGRPPP